MGRIDVAVNVQLDGGVQGNEAQTPGNLRMVRDFLGADNDFIVEKVDVFIEPSPVLSGQRDRTSGDEIKDTLLNQAERRVLHNLRVHTQSLEAAGGQTAQHRIAHGTHPGLNGTPGFSGRRPAAISPFRNLMTFSPI